MKPPDTIFIRMRTSWQRLYDHIFRIVTGLPQISQSAITPDIYLGGQFNINALTRLSRRGVTGIINMRTTPVPPKVGDRFRVLHLPTEDRHAASIEQFYQGVVFIQEEITRGGKVYVHCRWGEGRGPSMVIAYLMSIGMTLDDAYHEVQKVRTFIKITPEQFDQLQLIEKQYRTTRSRSLLEVN